MITPGIHPNHRVRAGRRVTIRRGETGVLNHRGAFTLIELLVAIGIIALLIGILLPVLSSARNAGRTAVCLGNMRTMGQSANTFAVDHRDQLPSNRVRTAAVPEYDTGTNATHITWRAYLVLKGYLPDGADAQTPDRSGSEVWLCPSSPTGALSEEGMFDGFATYCVDDVVSNYGYNGMLAWRYPPPFDAADIDLVKIRQPSHTIVFLETRSIWPDLRENSIYGRGTHPYSDDYPQDDGGYFSWWHAGDGHWGTFDGAVASMGLLETVGEPPRWRNERVSEGTYDHWPDSVADVYR